jgi:alpha-tubulin suppressor-like RCC1 family protein
MPRLADDTRSWLSVSAGNSFSAGVTRDGEVFTWGAQALANGGAPEARMVPTKIDYDLVLDVPLAQ